MRTSPRPRPSLRAGARRGSYTVEFAMLTLVFLGVVFCVIEVARAMYMWSMLSVVMQRAARTAAVTDVADVAAQALLRQRAVLRTSSGTLALGDPVTDAHVRIDYLAADQTQVPAASLPALPRQNLVNCINNFDGNVPGQPPCIRFVRARLCAPDGADGVCGAVFYRPLVPLVNLSFAFPPFTVLVKAESLGYLP